MPIPIPLIVAGAQLLGQGANAVAQGSMNRKTRQWNEKMYGVQRQDALADWNMQNQYNSPEMQMQRLEAAGLNPNLVYGSGSVVANSQSMPRQASTGSWNPRPQEFHPEAVLGAYYETKLQQAQLDNLAAQKELMQQEKLNKQATQFKTYADTALSTERRDLVTAQTQKVGVDVSYAPRIKEMSLQAMQASIDKTLQDTKLSAANTAFRLSENERQELKTGMTLKQAAERILLMRKDEILKESQIQNNYQQRQILISRSIQIDRQIEKLRGEIKQSDEKARLLQSTPDWGDQRSIDMLQGILGNYGKPGSFANPNTYKGWTR